MFGLLLLLLVLWISCELRNNQTGGYGLEGFLLKEEESGMV